MKKNLLVIFLTGILCANSYSQPAGWQYVLPVAVTENSGNTLINYQLNITVNTQALIANLQMNSNGDDIRFKSSCLGTNLNYWIESGINTASTSIWVEIDTLPANATRNIFMFYGNPSAAPASTLSTFNGPNSATDSVNITNAGGSTNSQRGFRFAPTEDILVSSFGKNEPNGTTRYVTLFNFGTQAIVSQTQVSGPIGIYSYSSIASPVWLTQGTQYILELYQGASDGYYFATSSQIGQHLTYFDMRYCNSCTQNTFPTNILTNYHYGLPDFLYYTKQNVTPAPTYLLNSAYQPASVFAGADTAFCAGNQVQIGSSAVSGYPPFTYLWTPSTDLDFDTVPSPIASPFATTTYVEIATDSFGCGVSDSVTITVYPLPIVTLVISPDTFCVNASSVTLTGGSPPGGTYSGPGVSAGMFDPNVAGAGTHAIGYSFTDSLGCSNITHDSIFVDICATVAPVNPENYFSVYPNPADGFLLIYFKNESGLKNISLFNATGEMVFQKETNLPEEKINLKNYSSGIYLLQIQLNNKTLRKKIVKE